MKDGVRPAKRAMSVRGAADGERASKDEILRVRVLEIPEVKEHLGNITKRKQASQK